MSILPKDVEHIAELARIELSKEEKIRFQDELSAILGFVEKLNQVDTKDIEPLSGGTNFENKFREDEIVDSDLLEKSKKLIESAPKKDNKLIKVPAIFE